MRDLRAVIHGITTAVLCGVAVFSCSTISKAAGETYQTAVEAAYGDTFRGVYENYLAGSPLEAENPDGVDTASGRCRHGKRAAHAFPYRPFLRRNRRDGLGTQPLL